MFIDTHAHIHQHALEESTDIVDRAVAAKVGAILTAGTTIKDSQKAIDMAARYENVFAGVGVHPTDLDHSLTCLLYTSPRPRDQRGSRMPSSA